MIKKLCAILILLALLINSTLANITPCIGRKYNHDSIVCVCNSQYCDELPKVKPLKRGEYVLYTSNLYGERFTKSNGKMKTDHGVEIKVLSHTVLHVNRNKKYQKILGFGGSFTDSSGLNILGLSKKTQERLINAYFGPNGIEYNIGRVPVGGTDFSPRNYVYNEFPEHDSKLSNFTLTYEDLNYKIPIIKRAQAVSTNKIHLMASSWDCPLWMKKPSYGSFETQIEKKYYQTWANYHLRFLEEYDKFNIRFDSITTGNEPGTAILPREILSITNFLGWKPQEQGVWLVENFGPTLRNSKFRNISILALDDQRYFLPFWIMFMAETEGSLNYIDGIAVHWYANQFSFMAVMNFLHNLYPDKYIISNEASISKMVKNFWDTEIVQLGAWDKAEKYISDIMDDLNNWHVGWIDWNLALNMEGGPNWSKNYVDASIIINHENDEFLKQPLFYVMGHFSKFLHRNSVRIHVDTNREDLANVAVLRKDNGVAIVIYNGENNFKTVIIQEIGKGHIELVLKPKSINTLIYW